jgi:hypothetical protein
MRLPCMGVRTSKFELPESARKGTHMFYLCQIRLELCGFQKNYNNF